LIFSYSVYICIPVLAAVDTKAASVQNVRCVSISGVRMECDWGVWRLAAF
jgi:hypothetical protein